MKKKTKAERTQLANQEVSRSRQTQDEDLGASFSWQYVNSRAHSGSQNR